MNAESFYNIDKSHQENLWILQGAFDEAKRQGAITENLLLDKNRRVVDLSYKIANAVSHNDRNLGLREVSNILEGKI